MAIAHPILQTHAVAASRARTIHIRARHRHKTLDVTRPRHLYIDADAPVEARHGAVDVAVGDARLDDFVEDAAGALVGGDAHLRFEPLVQHMLLQHLWERVQLRGG